MKALGEGRMSSAALRSAAARWRDTLDTSSKKRWAIVAPTLVTPAHAVERAAKERALAALAAEERQRATVEAAQASRTAEPPRAPPLYRRSQLRATLASTLDTLGSGLIERDAEVRLMLLAAVCGEHLLLLGPPGVGKSELARRLAALGEGAYFERQLTKFTLPEELFGPLSVAALQHDRLVRKTEGYLPSASVAFLDEIFKASSATCNALLSILNERLFEGEPVPLRCLVAASNEPPLEDELDALWDRFLFRRSVAPVSESAWPSLLTPGLGSRTPAAAAGASLPARNELEQLHDEARAVTMCEGSTAVIFDAFRLARDQATASGAPQPSDRRLVRLARALRIAACANGRDAVGVHELLLLPHLLCARPEDVPPMEVMLEEKLSELAEATDAAAFLQEGAFRQMWALALAHSPRWPGADAGAPPPSLDASAAEEAMRIAEDARSLIRALYKDAAATCEDEGSLPPLITQPSLWVSAESDERVRSALSAATERRQTRLRAMAEEARAMAIVAEQGVITPALLVAVVPSLAVKELRGMLAEDAGEDVQGKALAVLQRLGQVLDS